MVIAEFIRFETCEPNDSTIIWVNFSRTNCEPIVLGFYFGKDTCTLLDKNRNVELNDDLWVMAFSHYNLDDFL